MKISFWSLVLVPFLFLFYELEAASSNEIGNKNSIECDQSVVAKPPDTGVLGIFVECNEREIESLMKSGYDVFSTGIWDELMKMDHAEAVKYLLRYHFKDEESRKKAFRDAIFSGSRSIAEVVFDKYKSSVKPSSEVDQTTLVKIACERRYYGLIEMMAKEGYNVNFVDSSNYGRSVLHAAVISDNLKLVKLLLKFVDINLNIQDDYGNTPLHYASNIKMFTKLLEYEADPFLKNNLGINSLFMAQPSLASRFELFQFSLRNAFSNYVFTTYVINRERVLEDSFDLALREMDFYDSSFDFNIYFDGETGVDSGGLKREWMSLLIERFFVPRLRKDGEACESKAAEVTVVNQETNTESREIAVVPPSLSLREIILRSSRVYPKSNELYYGAPFECIDSTNKFYRISPSFTGPVEGYKFIGSMMAKALLMKVPLRVKLAPSIIKLLFEKSLTFEDIKDDDPVMYSSMLQYSNSESDGIENVQENLNETAVNAMYTRYKAQLDNFIEGFHFVLGPKMIEAFFTVSEFQEVVSGAEEINRSELFENIEIKGDYWKAQEQIFWAAMNLLNQNELLEFVKFITGINGLPFGGVSSLGKTFTIFDETVNKVPKTSTCDFHLRLPTSITNVEELVAMFRYSFASVPEFTD